MRWPSIGRGQLLPAGQLAVLLLASCGHPHPVPDQQLVADLRSAILATLAAGGQGALAAKQLDDESVELAWATDPARIRALREGRMSPAQLLDQARTVPLRIAARHAGQPPILLTWLLGHGPALTPPQLELLEALRAESELELAKSPH